VSLLYPGIDLEAFRETPPPSLPWKCVFASSPENEEEIHTKGVDLLLALAEREPSLEITLLWRPFGARSDAALERVRACGLANVNVVCGRVRDMASALASAHFAIAPFRTGGKPCPNSLLECLAVGRPVLVSSSVDIADLLVSEGCGVSFAPEVEPLRAAFHALTRTYASLRSRARPCAETHFDLEEMIRAYGRIYRRLASDRADRASRAEAAPDLSLPALHDPSLPPARMVR
jgi:glycosyltransferase involved in cell wall biosynthesis